MSLRKTFPIQTILYIVLKLFIYVHAQFDQMLHRTCQQQGGKTASGSFGETAGLIHVIGHVTSLTLALRSAQEKAAFGGADPLHILDNTMLPLYDSVAHDFWQSAQHGNQMPEALGEYL